MTNTLSAGSDNLRVYDKVFSLWIIVVEGLLEHPGVGVKLTLGQFL